MTPGRVAAIIVSYGPGARALRTADSLRAGNLQPAHVVIVHNGPELFDCPVPQDHALSVVQPERNLGYSGALRLGVATASRLEPDFEYLWLLNNDVLVHPRALQSLVAAAARHPDVGLWGSTMCSDETFADVSSAGVRYSHWTTRRRSVLAGQSVSSALAEPHDPDVDFLPGASMFISRTAYDECGGLSEDYFLYFEELDLAARLRAAGFGLRWCRGSLVAHAGGTSTGSYRRGRTRPPQVAYHAMRSAVVYTSRHAAYALPAVVLTRLGRHVVFEGIRGNTRTSVSALRGCLDGLRIARRRESR